MHIFVCDCGMCVHVYAVDNVLWENVSVFAFLCLWSSRTNKIRKHKLVRNGGRKKTQTSLMFIMKFECVLSYSVVRIYRDCGSLGVSELENVARVFLECWRTSTEEDESQNRIRFIIRARGTSVDAPTMITLEKRANHARGTPRTECVTFHNDKISTLECPTTRRDVRECLFETALDDARSQQWAMDVWMDVCVWTFFMCACVLTFTSC